MTTMTAGPSSRRVLALGTIFNAIEQMLDCPIERRCRSATPQTEQPRARCARRIRSGAIGTKMQSPVVAQNLKRRELPDELGIHIDALEQPEHLADVTQ